MQQLLYKDKTRQLDLKFLFKYLGYVCNRFDLFLKQKKLIKI